MRVRDKNKHRDIDMDLGVISPAVIIRVLIDQDKGLREGFGSTY